MGMEINDNDLIHADVHGAVTFSEEIIDELFDAIKFIEKREKIILNSCKSKNFSFPLFKKAFLKSQKLKY